MRGPPQPPSWELHDTPQHPDVSDDESDGDEVNTGDKPVSLAETRKEMEDRMQKKVRRWRIYIGGDALCSIEILPFYP